MSNPFDVNPIGRHGRIEVVTLRARVHEIIREKNVSKTIFYKESGVSRQLLSAAYKREMLTGDHNIDNATVSRLAKYSGRAEQWIMTGQEPAPRALIIDVDAMAASSDIRDRVIDALVADGLADYGEAYQVVRNIAFQHGTELALYRAARGILERQRSPDKAPVGERKAERFETDDTVRAKEGESSALEKTLTPQRGSSGMSPEEDESGGERGSTPRIRRRTSENPR